MVPGPRGQGRRPATAAQGFGNVVHVLADEVASGRTPPTSTSSWPAWTPSGTPSPSTPLEVGPGEAERARGARTLPELARHGPRRPHPAASEHDFDVTLEAGSTSPHPGLHGPRRDRRAGPRLRRRLQDRQVRPHQGRGRPPPAARRLPARRPRGRPRRGLRRAPPEPGGAELVQLRQAAPKKEGGDALPKVQAQEPLSGEWVGELLAGAAGRVLDERFTPPPASTAPPAPSGPRAAPGRRAGTSSSRASRAGRTSRSRRARRASRSRRGSRANSKGPGAGDRPRARVCDAPSEREVGHAHAGPAPELPARKPRTRPALSDRPASLFR